MTIKTAIENWLKSKSEIVYVFPAIPCIINFILVLVTSALFIIKRKEYDDCKKKHKQDEDYVYIYLSGQIIITYVFLIFYTNIILEYIPKFKGIIWNFLSLLIYFILALVWNVIGMGFLSEGKCSNTLFHTIGWLNVVVFFLFLGSCIFYIIALFVYKQYKKGGSNLNKVGAQSNKQQ